MKKILHLLVSKWFFIIYFALGIIYFIAFLLCVPDVTWEKSFFITLGLMTGSDPFSFNSPSIEPYKGFWWLSWVIHIESWLLIPALIGLVINEIAEEIKHDRDLKTATSELIKGAGIDSEKIDEVQAELQRELENWLKELKEKENDSITA